MSRGQFRGTHGLGECVVCDVTVKARAFSNFGVGGYPWVVRGSALGDVTVIARASSNFTHTVEAQNMNGIITRITTEARRRFGLWEGTWGRERVGAHSGTSLEWGTGNGEQNEQGWGREMKK